MSAPLDQRDRRAVLADAAIDLLAEEGMRALTHRAVDARAGMPQGTTSAYFRTRHALLTAIVKRLADLDRAQLRSLGLDLDSEGGSASAPAPAPAAPAGPLTEAELAGVAEGTAGFIDAALAGARNRTLARYHCRLESVTTPELRELLAPHQQAAFRQTRQLLARAGVPDLDVRARGYVAAIDGLIFDRLVGGTAEVAEAAGSDESRRALTVTVRALLAGALTGGRQGADMQGADT